MFRETFHWERLKRQAVECCSKVSWKMPQFKSEGNEIPGVGVRHRACSPSSMGPDGSVPHWADADTDADADANMPPILTGLYYATGQTLHGRQVYQHENWTQSIFYIYGEYDGWMLGPR